YKLGKHELGWADFHGAQRSRHPPPLAVGVMRFSFCWRAWFAEEVGTTGDAGPTSQADASACANSTVPAGHSTGRGKMGADSRTAPTSIVTWPMTLRRVPAWLDHW